MGITSARSLKVSQPDFNTSSQKVRKGWGRRDGCRKTLLSRKKVLKIRDQTKMFPKTSWGTILEKAGKLIAIK